MRGDKIPIPQNGPQYDPNKLAESKAMTEKDPYGKKNLDFMVLSMPNSKDLLMTYYGKWSLRALVESKEFALLIPYSLSRRMGYVRYECGADKSDLHRVSQYWGMMVKTHVEIDGGRVDGVYVLMGCEKGQLEHSSLWGTYDQFPLNSVVVDSVSSPLIVDRIESEKGEGERYKRTKKNLKKRYGKGSGFWSWGEKDGLFGKRKIEKLDGLKPGKAEL